VDYRAKERVEVLKAPGTVRIVTFADVPAPIPDDVIESIQILVGVKENVVKPHPLVHVGRRVRVVDGPFCGAIGRLQETDERNPKLVVEIEFLGRAVAVPINPQQVQPVFES
jgi:transcription antitermination factor NusG